MHESVSHHKRYTSERDCPKSFLPEPDRSLIKEKPVLLSAFVARNLDPDVPFRRPFASLQTSSRVVQMTHTHVLLRLRMANQTLYGL